jgi:hypothetical protein
MVFVAVVNVFDNVVVYVFEFEPDEFLVEVVLVLFVMIVLGVILVVIQFDAVVESIEQVEFE